MREQQGEKQLNKVVVPYVGHGTRLVILNVTKQFTSILGIQIEYQRTHIIVIHCSILRIFALIKVKLLN